MRARNIKPGLFKNEVLGIADPLLSLLFIGLWCLADREGRLEDRPMRIKAEIFPYRESMDISGYLTELVRLKFIIRYQVESGAYFISINNFHKHQHPHITEKASEIPPPPLWMSASAACDAPHEDNGYLTVDSTLNNGSDPSDSGFLIPDSGFTDSNSTSSNEEVRCSDHVSPSSKKDKKDPCKLDSRVKEREFFELIVDKYHEILPELRRMLKLTDKRQGLLRGRISEEKEREKIEWWNEYFQRVKRADWLCGRVEPRGERRRFFASFEWIIRPENMLKILEGAYDPEKPIRREGGSTIDLGIRYGVVKEPLIPEGEFIDVEAKIS